MKRKISYYRQAESFVAVTNESPPNFKDALFIGRRPTTPGDLSKIEEDVFTPDQLQGLVAVPKDQVPAVWMLAFGYEQPTAEKPAPEPPLRRIQVNPPPVIIDVAFPWEGEQGCLPIKPLHLFCASIIAVAVYWWIKTL